jgi:hypothetical protein
MNCGYMLEGSLCMDCSVQEVCGYGFLLDID